MKDNDNQEIPGMNLNNNYDTRPIPSPTAAQKETEKTKKELEKLKGWILKKYPFTEAVSVIPPQAIKMFIDEEELGIDTSRMKPEDIDKIVKKVHLQVIIPEEKFKEISKIRAEIVKQIDEMKQDIWLHIKTPVDLWELCLDSKFDLTSAVAMSFPLHDKGILGALRVAEIHKSLVLQKFEKYVVSYVVAGSLVRGEAVKTSDVDVFIVINDTDVKRMPRLELKERLRSMIYQYVQEAAGLAGVKNKLSPQVYLLTEFWESVKDASPVIFTFIRDGIPIYDRGTFMPWKALLKMGKLKPSPEAIDMFMSAGDKTVKRAKMALLDILVHDIFWGVITPSQALLMLYGLPPPTPKQTVKEMEKIFLTKEKMLEKKYINILAKIVGYFKDYEHEKLKEISGTEIDSLVKDTEDYLKRLKELREQIEKRSQEKTLEDVHKEVFDLLELIFGKKSKEALVKDFEKNLIKTGKLPQNSLKMLNEVIDAKADLKKKKVTSHSVNEVRKNATILINDLIDYSQRKDLMEFEKTRMRLKYTKDNKPAFAELIVSDGESFLINGGDVKKITNRVYESNMDELTKSLQNKKDKPNVEMNPEVFVYLRNELGDFEIVL